MFFLFQKFYTGYVKMDYLCIFKIIDMKDIMFCYNKVLLFIFLFSMSLVACQKMEIRDVEYDGTWVAPLAHTHISTERLLYNFLDSSLLERDDTTNMVKLVYSKDFGSIDLRDFQSSLLNIDTSFHFSASTSFPDIPGSGAQNIYHRDTMVIDLNDFTNELNVILDSLYLNAGAFSCMINLEIPEEWNWSITILSDNLKFNGIGFSHKFSKDSNSANISMSDYGFFPTNGSEMIFVSDLTLTVVGPCPADTVSFNMDASFSGFGIDRMFGDFSGLSYTYANSLDFDFDVPIDDWAFYGTKLLVALVTNLGSAFELTFDELNLLNASGETLTLIEPGAVYGFSCPSAFEEYVIDKISLNVPPELFTFKANRLDFAIKLETVEDNIRDYMTSDSRIYSGFSVEVPMQLRIDEIELTDSLSFDGLGLKESTADMLNIIDYCDIIIDIENSIPMDLSMMFVFLDSTLKVIDTAFGEMVNIKSAVVDSDTHDVISPAVSTLTWNLTPEKTLEINDARMIYLLGRINTTAGEEYVKIRYDGALDVSFKARIKFNDIEFNN